MTKNSDNDDFLNKSAIEGKRIVDRLKRIGDGPKVNRQKEIQMLAEESVLARNQQNIVFGSVLLPMGEYVEGAGDEYHTDSSEEDDEKIFKDRMVFQNKSESMRHRNISDAHKTEVLKGSFRVSRRKSD